MFSFLLSCPVGVPPDSSVEFLSVMSSTPPPVLEEVKKTVINTNIKVSTLLVQSNGNDMNTLKRMLESNILKPHVSATFPFEKMAEAHMQLESGRTVGKVVVTL